MAEVVAKVETANGQPQSAGFYGNLPSEVQAFIANEDAFVAAHQGPWGIRFGAQVATISDTAANTLIDATSRGNAAEAQAAATALSTNAATVMSGNIAQVTHVGAVDHVFG